jgi:hypothetical protein
MSNQIPDCLVLKLEEVERNTNYIDTTLYIIYDKKNNNYLIRGQRNSTPKYQACTYSFTCELPYQLADFIGYIISSDNRINETLFNYDNLPYLSNDITYDFLYNNEHIDYEISGYDNKKLKRKRILRNLRILKDVYNNY